MIYIFVSILLLAFIAWVDVAGNKGSPKIVTTLAVCYFYSSFGPIIAFYTGRDIYFGTIVGEIDRAALLSTLCIGGLAIGAWVGAIYKAPAPVSRLRKLHVPTLRYANLINSLYLATSALMIIIAVYFHNYIWIPKTAKSFPYNYQLITLWNIFFICKFALTLSINRSLVAGIIAFTIYCLVFSERDFVFVILSCVIFSLKSQITNPTKVVPIIVIIFTTLWFLSVGRGGVFDSDILVSILNQGSNLFVNTFVLQYINWTDAYAYGSSYINSILRTLTFNQIDLGSTLSSWLVVQYLGEGREAGYGFSLEAEAYLNFGYSGPVVLFGLVGLYIQRYLSLQGFAKYSRRIAAVFVTTTLIYSFRNESLNVLKTIFYIFIVIKFCQLITSTRRPDSTFFYSKRRNNSLSMRRVSN